MLQIKNLTKTYKAKGTRDVIALNNISVDFPSTGMVFLLGKSGSGKSTLLNVIGGLDSLEGGEIIIKGKSSQSFTSSDFDSYRNTYIGFIFQEYNILEEFTVEKNISLALELQGKPADKKTIDQLLAQVDMQGLGDRKPNQLSGGQKQRVAIARALIKDPEIIMADEPTGALDSTTGAQVFETLKNLSKDHLVIVVSHDRDFAETYGDRIIELKDGKILTDKTKRLASTKQISDKVMLSGDTLFIEPGHKPTDNEKDFIVDKILRAGGTNGVIISTDKHINKNFKKFAKMDESGNREFFNETKQEDIMKSTDQSFKLIKSRFKYWDSFKMGASGLKVKKVRIGFTILLAAIALTFFGVADTAASFNNVRAMHDSIISAGDTTLGVVRRERQDLQTTWFDSSMTQTDITAITTRFPSHSFIGASQVGDSWSGFQFQFGQHPSGDYYVPVRTAFNFADNDYLDQFGLSMLHGDLPAAVNQVAITDWQFANFQRQNWPATSGGQITQVDTWADIENRTFEFSDSRTSVTQNLTIVGVIRTGFDSSRYAGLRDGGSSNFSEWLLVDELRNVFMSGFANSLFIHADNPLRQAPQFIFTWSHQLSLLGGDTSPIASNSIAPVANIPTSDRMFFDESQTGLTQHQVLVPAYTLKTASNHQLFSFFVSEQGGNTEVSFDIVDHDGSWLYNTGPFSTPAALRSGVRSALTIHAAYIEQNIPSLSLARELVVNNQWQDVSIADLSIVGVHHPFLSMSAFTDVQTMLDISWGTQNQGFHNATLFRPEDLSAYGLSRYFELQFPVLVTMLQNQGADRELIDFLMTESRDGLYHYDISNQFSGFFNNFTGIVNAMASVFMYIGIVFAVFSALLIMSYITMTISYKKRDIGILRAIGARRFDIYKIFFNQSIIITFIQFLVAIALTMTGVILINTFIGSELGQPVTLLAFGIRQIGLLAAIAVAVAVVASFLPTRKISKLKPIDAIQNRK